MTYAEYGVNEQGQSASHDPRPAEWHQSNHYQATASQWLRQTPYGTVAQALPDVLHASPQPVTSQMMQNRYPGPSALPGYVPRKPRHLPPLSCEGAVSQAREQYARSVQAAAYAQPLVHNGEPRLSDTAQHHQYGFQEASGVQQNISAVPELSHSYYNLHGAPQRQYTAFPQEQSLNPVTQQQPALSSFSQQQHHHVLPQGPHAAKLGGQAHQPTPQYHRHTEDHFHAPSQQQALQSTLQQPLKPQTKRTSEQHDELQARVGQIMADRWFWDTPTDFIKADGEKVAGTCEELYVRHFELRRQIMELYDSLRELGALDADLEGSSSALLNPEPAGFGTASPQNQTVEHDTLAGGEQEHFLAKVDHAQPSPEHPTQVQQAQQLIDSAATAPLGPQITAEQPDQDTPAPKPRRQRPPKPEPPINPAVVLVRQTIESATDQKELTLTELEDQHFTTPNLREALLLVVNQGIFGNLPEQATEESREIGGRWWKLQGVRVDDAEVGRLWRRDVLGAIVECCGDVRRLKGTRDVKVVVKGEGEGGGAESEMM